MFGRINIKIKSVMEEVKKLDEKARAGGLNATEEDNRNYLRGEVERLLISEEIRWRQKSRAQWLKEGDRNTKFFHKMESIHKNANQISNLWIEGQLIEERGDIKEGIVGFYSKLYSDSGDWRPSLDGAFFKLLGVKDRGMLELPFSEEEVVVALRSMSGDKGQMGIL